MYKICINEMVTMNAKQKMLMWNILGSTSQCDYEDNGYTSTEVIETLHAQARELLASYRKDLSEADIEDLEVWEEIRKPR